MDLRKRRDREKSNNQQRDSHRDRERREGGRRLLIAANHQRTRDNAAPLQYFRLSGRFSILKSPNLKVYVGYNKLHSHKQVRRFYHFILIVLFQYFTSVILLHVTLSTFRLMWSNTIQFFCIVPIIVSPYSVSTNPVKNKVKYIYN